MRVAERIPETAAESKKKLTPVKNSPQGNLVKEESLGSYGRRIATSQSPNKQLLVSVRQFAEETKGSDGGKGEDDIFMDARERSNETLEGSEDTPKDASKPAAIERSPAAVKKEQSTLEKTVKSEV